MGYNFIYYYVLSKMLKLYRWDIYVLLFFINFCLDWRSWDLWFEIFWGFEINVIVKILLKIKNILVML